MDTQKQELLFAKPRQVLSTIVRDTSRGVDPTASQTFRHMCLVVIAVHLEWHNTALLLATLHANLLTTWYKVH